MAIYMYSQSVKGAYKKKPIKMKERRDEPIRNLVIKFSWIERVLVIEELISANEKGHVNTDEKNKKGADQNKNKERKAN